MDGLVKGLKRIRRRQKEMRGPWGWPVKGLTGGGTADNGGRSSWMRSQACREPHADTDPETNGGEAPHVFHLRCRRGGSET